MIFEERQLRVLAVLQSAAATIYSEIGEKLANFQTFPVSMHNWCFLELEELSNRCCLVSDVLKELQELSGRHSLYSTGFATELGTFTSCFTDLVVGVVFPETVRAALSQDSAVIEAFASLSQIQETIAATLSQVAQVEAQKVGLIELEQSYPMKMEEFSKRKAFLEAAAADSRDELSWEEAEELASQEEMCREQLEKLQSAWTQRGADVTSVLRTEGLIQSALANAEQRYEVLVALDTNDLHLMRRKVLLAAFDNLFSGLESLEVEISSELQNVWKVSHFLKGKTFFVWKVYVINALLDACLRDTSTDLNLSLYQCTSQQTRRLDVQLQRFLDLYLRQRVAPAFLDLIVKETVALRPPEYEVGTQTLEAVKKAVKLLREYCNVHETVQAAKTVASSLKSQTEEAKRRLKNAQIEIDTDGLA